MKKTVLKNVLVMTCVLAFQFLLFVFITDIAFYTVNALFYGTYGDEAWKETLYFFNMVFLVLCFIGNSIFMGAGKKSYNITASAVLLAAAFFYWAGDLTVNSYRSVFVIIIAAFSYLCGTYLIHQIMPARARRTEGIKRITVHHGRPVGKHRRA